MKVNKAIGFIIVLIVSLSSSLEAQTLKDAIKPVVKTGGFKMEGYILWCPSVIKVGNTYHMFASRRREQDGLAPTTHLTTTLKYPSFNNNFPFLCYAPISLINAPKSASL